MFGSDPLLVSIAEPIVDLDGGGNAREEGRAQLVKDEVGICQKCEAKRWNELGTKSMLRPSNNSVGSVP